MAYTKELNALLKQSRDAYRAMKPNLDDAHATRIYAKEAKESRLLHAMDTLDDLELSGIGTLEMSNAVLFDGKPTVRMCPPSQFTIPRLSMSNSKIYGDTHTLVKFPCEDWRAYNRLTFRIYPELPTYDNVYFLITLVNDRKEDLERSGLLADTLILQLKSGEWNRVVWEIPNTHRDRITGIQLRCTVDGRQSGSDLWKTFYFGPIHLEKVDEDFYEGWELDNRIAFCHVGYQPGMPKLAYTQTTNAASFDLLDAETKEVVFTAPVTTLSCSFGDYAVMDFTLFDVPGSYLLRIDDRTTKPIRIDCEAYASPIWKAINFFYQERCGCEVEGVHRVCHLDTYCEHPDGRLISSGGGWHDAGDLSQGLCNTSESAHAMLDLAMHIGDSDPRLTERLLDEARWALDWCMKTRFGDGYRARWTRIGTWTNNILGDMDDLVLPAAYDPFENFCGAAAEAAGARAFRAKDPVYADYCLQCAKEDFYFAYKRAFNGRISVQTLGQGCVAAGELYKVCGDEDILKKGAQLAKHVLTCQQKNVPDWDKPIRGFFYESNRPDSNPLAYSHRAHEQSPVMGIALLLEAAPHHPDAAKWRESLTLYAEYIKTIVAYTAPYGILPNAIYKLGSGGRNAEMFYAQIKNGIRLSDEYYLRIFPVASDFRGYNGTLLTKAKAVTATARVLEDDALNKIAQRQLEWVLGLNPFAQCTMYGEGYNYPDLFVMFSHQLVGGVPVGIWTDADHDKPNFPQMNNATYKEVWVHTTSRFLWVCADLYPVQKKCKESVIGILKPKEHENTTMSRMLDRLDTDDGIEFRGLGMLEVSREMTYDGRPVLQLTAPNTVVLPPESRNRTSAAKRNYGKTSLLFNAGEADWTDANTISVMVYPDCEGCRTVTLEMSLFHPADTDDGTSANEYKHKLTVTNRCWNKVTWDITAIPHDSVQELHISYPLIGTQPNMNAYSTLYFSCLCLENTEHTSKIYAEKTLQDKAHEKLLRLCQRRCGCGVPGEHLPCHEDCFCVHPDGRRVPIGGAWHDGDDFDHNLVRTVEIVTELLEDAQNIKSTDQNLYYMLIDEARHGLEWMLRTRFEDGYRCVDAPIAVWTKGIIGDADDVKCPAHHDPYANFCAATIEAKAAVLYHDHDETFAKYARKCAEEDFSFAYERIGLTDAQYDMEYSPSEVDMYAKAVSAANALFAATENTYYLERAKAFSKKA